MLFNLFDIQYIINFTIGHNSPILWMYVLACLFMIDSWVVCKIFSQGLLVKATIIIINRLSIWYICSYLNNHLWYPNQLVKVPVVCWVGIVADWVKLDIYIYFFYFFIHIEGLCSITLNKIKYNILGI